MQLAKGSPESCCGILTTAFPRNISVRVRDITSHQVESKKQIVHACTGQLPRPIAAHFTPNGGWVEFHPDATLPQPPPYSSSSSRPAEATEPLGQADLPISPTPLQPLIWFRLCTKIEQNYCVGHAPPHTIVTHELQQAGPHLPTWWIDNPLVPGATSLLLLSCPLLLDRKLHLQTLLLRLSISCVTRYMVKIQWTDHRCTESC